MRLEARTEGLVAAWNHPLLAPTSNKNDILTYPAPARRKRSGMSLWTAFNGDPAEEYMSFDRINKINMTRPSAGSDCLDSIARQELDD